MRAKITDEKHIGTLYTSTIPWRMFAMDMQASIKGNMYQCIIIDTYSKYVWSYCIVTSDEVYSIISDFCETEIVKLWDFCETEIVKLWGRDFKIFLMSDLGEAHSKKIIKICSKHGIFKQTTAECTPQVNAF